ncbi:UDP-N-acetylmuramoyl-tripeptide--D-alanyl-D-alanine ligase [Bacillus sp. TS-2]|nr:UDP-N-acetylmuramoyl-tripeptide--D-alanyl-D-alanine ligase [Bacillus sp. TS-2]
MLTSDLISASSTLSRSIGTQKFSSVAFDTRILKKGALYIPLVAARNGHSFIQDAINKGAIGALWNINESVPANIPESFQLYFVEDTLISFQQMAKTYRDLVNPIVVAVTGSNGKTTTKDILESLLSIHGETFKTEGNFNNHIGLPMTILSMPSSCQYLILEMGMSAFGEIELLSNIAKPNLAVVTNIGESHMEFLGSREGIAKAKMEITSGLLDSGKVYLDGDEKMLEPYYSNKVVKIGVAKTNDYVISKIEPKLDGFHFFLGDESFKLSLLGRHNVKNASICIALVTELGFDYKQIQAGLSRVSLTGMRLEKSIGANGEWIINDAYNASPTSMIAAIETIKDIPDKSKKIVVLGDIFELGEQEELLHRQVASSLVAPITDILLVGEKAKWIYDEWFQNHRIDSINVEYFLTKEEAERSIASKVNNHTVILFKASRGMELEQLINQYQQSRKEG